MIPRFFRVSCEKLFLARIDADALTVHAETLELHCAIGKSEERIVRTDSDIQTRVHLRAALADEDITCNNCFAAKTLYAEALGIGIATVLSTTGSFFMCHCLILLKLCDAYIQNRKSLTMTVRATVIFTTLFLEDDDRLVAVVCGY